jgi:hypothetical protein
MKSQIWIPLTIVLKSIMTCEIIGLDERFQCTSCGYVFFKACWYVTPDEKLCKNLIFVLIKFAQSKFYECIILA